MSFEKSTWYSHRVDREITLARWGAIGRPVLLFPTAGGDAEECERFHMIDVLAPQLEEGRIKVFSVDSVAAQHWFTTDNSFAGAGRVQHAFDECIAREVVPAIHQDCGGAQPIVTAGASIGAFNALAAMCRHPDLFDKAICMSGTYDLAKFLRGPEDPEYHRCSPIHFLPQIGEGPYLDRLRKCFVLLAHGEGRWESPEESWKVERCLGRLGVPNRVDSWGKDYIHDWMTWREMLPKYLGELG